MTRNICKKRRYKTIDELSVKRTRLLRALAASGYSVIPGKTFSNLIIKGS